MPWMIELKVAEEICIDIERKLAASGLEKAIPIVRNAFCYPVTCRHLEDATTLQEYELRILPSDGVSGVRHSIRRP